MKSKLLLVLLVLSSSFLHGGEIDPSCGAYPFSWASVLGRIKSESNPLPILNEEFDKGLWPIYQKYQDSIQGSKPEELRKRLDETYHQLAVLEQQHAPEFLARCTAVTKKIREQCGDDYTSAAYPKCLGKFKEEQDDLLYSSPRYAAFFKRRRPKESSK